MTTRNLLIGFLSVLTAAWAWDALLVNPMIGDWPWLVRQHSLYLTGLWSIGLMSLTMMLATRPAWLESPLGGMDKIYQLHKWAGILAIGFGVAHWLAKLGGSPLKDLIGTVGRPGKMALLSFMAPAHSLAKDVGEWAIYVLIFMLLISLWKRFPYRPWRLLHKAMPVLYLLLVFHTVALLPASYWAGATGMMTALLLAGGTAGATIALRQRIGRGRQYKGHIVATQPQGTDTLEVICDAGKQWPGHRPGQFAFVTFDRTEGAHPFTIASAPQPGSQQITFQIKALGDYTRTLSQRLHAGQPVCIEGPYGRLDYRKGRRNATQVWVAGGIGVTPFLAWLESMKQTPVTTPIQMHYCVRNAASDPFAQRIQALCDTLPNVSLHLHDASLHQHLRIQDIVTDNDNKLDLWFCGPSGLAKHLRTGLKQLGRRGVTFHQEAFEMR